jgi:hypothetical protein
VYIFHSSCCRLEYTFHSNYYRLGYIFYSSCCQMEYNIVKRLDTTYITQMPSFRCDIFVHIIIININLKFI